MISKILDDEKYQFYAANFLIFLISFVLFSLFQKFRKTTMLFLSVLTTVVFIALFFQKVQQENSKYKEFGVKRYTSSNSIKSKFRKTSRDILNSNLEDKDNIYANLQSLVELLGENNKRIVYDKFGKIFENQDFDGKEFKELYYNLLKMTFYDIINICFFWIIVSSVFCRVIRTFDIFNHSLKAIIICHFIFVYYMYSHDVNEISFFDYFFPEITMKTQIYYIEFIFAFVLGIVWANLKTYLDDRRQKLNTIYTLIENNLTVSNSELKPDLVEIKKDLQELKKILK